MTDDELRTRVREAADATAKEHPDDIKLVERLWLRDADERRAALRRFVDSVWERLGRDFPVNSTTVGELARWTREREWDALFSGVYMRGYDPDEHRTSQEALEALWGHFGIRTAPSLQTALVGPAGGCRR